MKLRLLTTLAVAVCALTAVSASTAGSWQPGLGYWITSNAAETKLQYRHDFASCFGLQRFGTQSLRTSEYTWEKGYWRFECSYDDGNRHCYGAWFDSTTGARKNTYFMRLVKPGRCYSI